MDDKEMIYIETFNFEIEPYQWYQWVVKMKPPFYNYTCPLFTCDLEAQYEKVWEPNYFSQLTKMRYLGDIEDYDS
jgi:hypothetical protein